uniref:cell cycle checkpoint protein RAD17 n=1 Tax=Myxine glutinosa TaxID=7769 RepID=UPI00358EF200
MSASGISESKSKHWVRSNFDEFGAKEDSFSSSRKSRPSGVKGLGRDRVQSKADRVSSFAFSKAPKAKEDVRGEAWVDIHSPSTKGDLAVHRKKIEEVETWLQAHMLEGKQVASILLLTGPAGAGKTATLQVLAREMHIDVQEWTNPLSGNPKRSWLDLKDEWQPKEDVYQSTQVGTFRGFLLRATKYPVLDFGKGVHSGRRMILLEDMPNQFYREPSLLHDVLRWFVRTGRCPLIIIISDCPRVGSGESRPSDRVGGVFTLLPRKVQEELSVTSISFNPVAPTSLQKVLNRIASMEAKKSSHVMVPDRVVLEHLCAGSTGDIRSAINSLQFTCFAGSLLLPPPPKMDEGIASGCLPGQLNKKRERTGKRVPLKRGGKNGLHIEQKVTSGRDISLFIFHALGKILHCKRDVCSVPNVQHLPPHLSDHERQPLLVDPESVLQRLPLSGELFFLYLHQNYLSFLEDLDDLSAAADAFSFADALTRHWTSWSTMCDYSACVTTRAMLFAKRGRVPGTPGASGPGWMPLHKPQYLDVKKKSVEQSATAQDLFKSWRLPSDSLLTELLPFLAYLGTPLHNPAQIVFVQEIGRVTPPRFRDRQRLETIGEREDLGESFVHGRDISEAVDFPGDKPVADALPSSQGQPGMAQDLHEKELIIEEFDSD